MKEVRASWRTFLGASSPHRNAEQKGAVSCTCATGASSHCLSLGHPLLCSTAPHGRHGHPLLYDSYVRPLKFSCATTTRGTHLCHAQSLAVVYNLRIPQGKGGKSHHHHNRPHPPSHGLVHVDTKVCNTGSPRGVHPHGVAKLPPPDSIDVWPWIVGDVAQSPRTEVRA